MIDGWDTSEITLLGTAIGLVTALVVVLLYELYMWLANGDVIADLIYAGQAVGLVIVGSLALVVGGFIVGFVTIGTYQSVQSRLGGDVEDG